MDDAPNETPVHGGRCESCGMPIEAGPYCPHCVDESGALQSFDVRFERMVDFMLRQDPCVGRPVAEGRARAYMGTMPAWAGHPGLEGRE